MNYMDKDLEKFAPVVDMELDPGIRRAVLILRRGGIETFESCQSGEGHCFPEPTVRFYGDKTEGFKAVAIALQHALPVNALRRYYAVNDGELHGPCWEITFRATGHAKGST